VNGLSGLGGGAVYQFDFAAPEPATFWPALGCLGLMWKRLRRSRAR